MMQDITHVISDVCDRPNFTCMIGLDHVGKIPLVDLDIDVKSRAEGLNLHVVTPGTAFCHDLQVLLKHSINIFLRGRGESYGRVVCPRSLSFGIPTCPTTRVDIEELFVVGSMLPHVIYDSCPYGRVLILGTIYLIGEGVE